MFSWRHNLQGDTGMYNVRISVMAAAVALSGGVAAESVPGPTGEAAEVWGRTTIARPAAEWDENGKPAKIEFDFGDFKMWARKKGGWQIEGWLHHRGLLCGTYYVAVRFGIGDAGCNNVKWLSDPRYVTQRVQCNNASVLHSGGDVEFPHAAQFADITCAERIVRCTGNCQLSFQGDKPGGVPYPTQPRGP
jgi:hypothetical protein